MEQTDTKVCQQAFASFTVKGWAVISKGFQLHQRWLQYSSAVKTLWAEPIPAPSSPFPAEAAVVPAAKRGTLPASPTPSFTCLMVQPEPWSGSSEADPAYQAGSSRGLCHHMADPGPAASPGVLGSEERIRACALCVRVRVSSSLQRQKRKCSTDVVTVNSWKNTAMV